MHTPPTPATDVQIVSDDTLRLLARHDPQRALGELDAEDQAILCMTLGDICDELLAYRRTARRKIEHLRRERERHASNKREAAA